MALTVASLRQQLRTLPGGVFTVRADALALPAAATLFSDYLKSDALVLHDATADENALLVRGRLALSGMASDRAEVSFAVDAARQNVTGLRIVAAVHGWKLSTSKINFSGALLQAAGFADLSLVLDAWPDGAGQPAVAPHVTLAAARPFTTKNGPKTLTLLADLPEPPITSYTFRGDFDDVALADLSALAPLASGASFAVPPEALDHFASELHLRAMSVVIDPKQGTLPLVALEVRAGSGWSIVPGKFDLGPLDLTFTVVAPLGVRKVFATIASEFGLTGGVPVGALVRLPDLYLEAELTEPITLQTVLGVFLPGTDIEDFPVDLLRFWVDVKTRAYRLNVGLEGKWKLNPAVELTNLSLAIAGQGTAVATGMMEATFALKTAKILLTADYDHADGWRFHGRTAPGAKLAIAEVVADLASRFGIALPTPLARLTLESVSLEFVTKAPVRRFTFGCAGTFPLGDREIAANVTIAITPVDLPNGGTRNDVLVAGELTFPGERPLVFDLGFERKNSGPGGARVRAEAFIATYRRRNGDPDTLSIRNLVGRVSSALGDLVPSEITIGLKGVKFAAYRPAGAPASQLAFAVDLGTGFDLRKLPLIDRGAPGGNALAVHGIAALATSAAFDADAVATLNPLFANAGVPLLPAGGLDAGFNFRADVQVGAATRTLSLDARTTTPAAPARAAAPAAKSDSPSGITKWLNVQKSLGPLTCRRVGLSYQSGTLLFLIDGSFTLGAMTIELLGLSMGSPLTRFDLTGNLQGVGLDFNGGPIEIDGAFLNVKPPPAGTTWQFDGAATVKFADVAVAALGSFAQLDGGAASLFVFGHATGKFGGPPSCYITGLSTGFGYNRRVTIPAQDEVLDFPLLNLPDAGASDSRAAMADVLAVLEGRQPGASGATRAWIEPNSGEYWLAAGVDFSSFELVRSRALLIAKFGGEFELTLLGLSKLRLPKDGGRSYAYVELELEAAWKPAAGFFGMSAVLGPASYVIDPACRLTGGFAFHVWYAGEHDGQFVLTLGGYHPQFPVPAWFPREPRLGFNWAVSDHVTIKGEAYFALTPSCVMGGGRLDLQFHAGDLKAWFTAAADFLVSWKPFHYLAEVSVCVGASYRLHLLFCTVTVSAELGASLALWGPPTGGRVHVHWWAISFTISFGSSEDSGSGTPLVWSEFQALLPPAHDVCKIQLGDGLLRKLDRGAWLVRADRFRFQTESAVPATTLRAVKGRAFNSSVPLAIRPMNVAALNSRHTFQLDVIGRDGQPNPAPHDLSDWRIEAITRPMPVTLWGAPLKNENGDFVQNPLQPSSETIAPAPIGLRVRPLAPVLGPGPAPIAQQQLDTEPLPAGEMPLRPRVTPTADFVPAFNAHTIGALRKIADARARRSALVAALRTAEFYSAAGADDPMTALGRDAANLYSSPPLAR